MAGPNTRPTLGQSSRNPAPSPSIPDPDANHPFNGRPRAADTRPAAYHQKFREAAKNVALAWRKMTEIGEDEDAERLKRVGDEMFGAVWAQIIQEVVEEA